MVLRAMDQPSAFTWLPFLPIGWIALVIAVSIAFRRSRGKQLVPKSPPDAIFSERGCSGRSLDTPWAKLGGARNCLLVALTPERIVISPVFPFNLMFLPEIFGLDHSIRFSDIQNITDRWGIFSRHVMVTYGDPRVRRMELRLQKREAFLERLRQLGVRITVID